ERRLLGSATGPHREIGDAIRSEATGPQARETGQIEVTSRELQSKLVLRPLVAPLGQVRCAEGGAAGKWSAEDTGFDVVELKLASGEAEIAFQQRNADSVGQSVVKIEVSIAVRTGACARNGDGHIESASQRLSDSGQLRDFREAGVAHVKVQ